MKFFSGLFGKTKAQPATKLNSAGSLSRFLAILVAVIPLFFAAIMTKQAGTTIFDLSKSLGFYCITLLYLSALSIHIYFNLLDYDMYLKQDKVIFKRYFDREFIADRKSVIIEPMGYLSIFLFLFKAKTASRTFYIKKTPRNLSERLNPELIANILTSELKGGDTSINSSNTRSTNKMDRAS